MATNKGQTNGLQAAAGGSGSTDLPAANKAAAARKAITAQISPEGNSAMASWPFSHVFMSP
jgi:hypothetical protein